MVKKKILAIDDEPLILRLMQTQLKLEGYEVEPHGDASQALLEIKKENGSQTYLAVLLDLNLQSENGKDVLKAIKVLDAALPVIMVTGMHEEVEARESIEMGALDFVTKPIDFNYLKHVLAMQR